MSLSVDVALDHACTRLNRVTLQPFFVHSLRAHTFSARASTRTMFKIEVVITEPPWDETIDVWLYHLDTVERVKQIIKNLRTIPEDVQRVFLPGRGTLDNEFLVARLYTSPAPPPRLFLEVEDQDQAAEVPGESWGCSASQHAGRQWWLASVGDVPVAAGASSAVSECGSSADLSAAEDSLQFEHSRLSPPPQQLEFGAVDGARTHRHEMLARRVVARPDLEYVARDGEVRYVFAYHSTGVSSSVLILIRTVREELLCEFLTRGHVAEPHGEWSLDSMRLQVWFHDHFCDEDSLMMPVSPTTFYRDRADPNHWIQDSLGEALT